MTPGERELLIRQGRDAERDSLCDWLQTTMGMSDPQAAWELALDLHAIIVRCLRKRRDA